MPYGGQFSRAADTREHLNELMLLLTLSLTVC